MSGISQVRAAAARLNARHPWSHNDYFHNWIMVNLPTHRGRALDVGCGQGELLARLATAFDEVVGIDRDAGMRQQAASRCAGLSHVEVRAAELAHLTGTFDLVTMVAVLHHLVVPDALNEVRRLLAPGGRFLAVGLAPARSVRDHLWELASTATNPLIGYVVHPWPDPTGPRPPPFPVVDPTRPFDELRRLVTGVMPGAVMRHRLGFRHTIAWSMPSG